jgi:hypothetical protein
MGTVSPWPNRSSSTEREKTSLQSATSSRPMRPISKRVVAIAEFYTREHARTCLPASFVQPRRVAIGVFKQPVY